MTIRYKDLLSLLPSYFGFNPRCFGEDTILRPCAEPWRTGQAAKLVVPAAELGVLRGRLAAAGVVEPSRRTPA